MRLAVSDLYDGITERAHISKLIFGEKTNIHKDVHRERGYPDPIYSLLNIFLYTILQISHSEKIHRSNLQIQIGNSLLEQLNTYLGSLIT